MNYEMTTEEKLENVSRKILISSRNELYMKMRFLDVALSSLSFVLDPGADGLGTDGIYLYYNPRLIDPKHKKVFEKSLFFVIIVLI